MRVVTLMLMLCSAAVLAQEPKPLRAIVSDSNTAPYAIFAADASLQAGLSKDIIDELGRQLGRPVHYLNLPRTRVEPWLLEGKAELGCFLNPDWVTAAEQLLWTDALFTTQQLLIRRHDSAPLTGIQYLAGKRVGTTWGFTYPELEQVFRSGDVIRDDAHSLESNLQRLLQGRLDVVMTVDLSYHFYQKTAGDLQLAADPLWSEPPAVYCALSRYDMDAAAELKQQFRQLVQSGFIARQLAFYMGRSARD
ncbi:substrate-binding periplasmic protein [Rheinheimera maricola]|uniref:Transporter substrate-binding domain-containing protein n=1 Tax=Rheinheimera maricola TaxID=2793282 RepID=A0ABS7XDF3_9GAMM|nr:transporter substrate-binding domain-containing protein [Rheinheimera maricola]MBZ9613594.1 transporter substrate-binding domain-containing protein [Rheinheimera maricola]